MAWKNERKVHVDGQEWQWVVVRSGSNPGVLVRSPDRKVHRISYHDLYPGLDLKQDRETGEWSGPGIAPNEVKEYIETYLIGE